MHAKFSESDEDIDQLDVDRPATEPSFRLRFSLASLLITVMIVATALGALVGPIRRAQLSSQQNGCRSNLQLIGLGLLNYYDCFKSFPPAIVYGGDGTPRHSWRILILPYVTQQSLYNEYNFDEPWNGPSNSRFVDEIPDAIPNAVGVPVVMVRDARWFGCRCPSAPSSQNRMCTNYVMLIDDRPGKPNGPPNLPGSVPSTLDPNSAVIVIENADSDIHWLEPRDVLLSELSMKMNDRSKRSLSSYHGGACVLHADGTVEMLDDATTEERLREMLTQ